MTKDWHHNVGSAGSVEECCVNVALSFSTLLESSE